MSSSKMAIAVSRSIGIPLMTQIRDQIVTAIAVGHLTPGDRLPTIRELAKFLAINRNTVAQVYRLLETEGYVSTRAGGGTTVSATPVTADAVRASRLRQLVDQALLAAQSAGFSAREFAELAYYQSAQQQLHPSVVVIDEYRGELSFLCETIRDALPGSNVHGMLQSELAAVPAVARAERLGQFDFALVPFYCFEQVTGLLTGCDIPTLAAGVGPSLKVLQQIRDASADQVVAIVCSEQGGPQAMEQSLRQAGVALGDVHPVHLGDDNLAGVLAQANLVIASEASAETVRALTADATPIITYSAILSAESLATIRSYAGYVTQQRGTRSE